MALIRLYSDADWDVSNTLSCALTLLAGLGPDRLVASKSLEVEIIRAVENI